MFVLNEAAALLDPVDVNLLQKIVPEKNPPNKDETRDEGEAGEVVHVFGHLGDIRESVWTNERQKHDFSKGDVQAGQAENDKGHRRQPMPKPLKGLEAKHLPAGAPFRDRDTPDDQIAGTQKPHAAPTHDSSAPYPPHPTTQ